MYKKVEFSGISLAENSADRPLVVVLCGVEVHRTRANLIELRQLAENWRQCDGLVWNLVP